MTTDTAPRLTPRERQVLAGRALGLTSPQIAHHLGTKEATVRRQLRSAAKHLGCHGSTSLAVHIACQEDLLRPRVEGSPNVILTTREREVLAGICSGLTYRQIARAMGRSEHTAKTHARRLFKKIRAQSRSHAAALAHQHHYLTAPTRGELAQTHYSLRLVSARGNVVHAHDGTTCACTRPVVDTDQYRSAGSAVTCSKCRPVLGPRAMRGAR
jgi:DNA-binding NarL/FixJ family response regulator